MSINDLTKMSYFHLDVQYNAHVIGNIKFYGAVILPVKLLRKGGDSILKTEYRLYSAHSRYGFECSRYEVRMLEYVVNLATRPVQASTT